MPPKKNLSATQRTALLPVRDQVLYILLFISAIFAGLWQYGHPRVVLPVLAGILPAAVLARLTLGRVGKLGISALQTAITLLALIWGWFRFRDVAIDLVIMEVSVILSLALLLKPDRSYSWLAITSLILVGYGGMTPFRQVYVTAVVPFVCIGAIFLYKTRTSWLAGRHIQEPREWTASLLARSGHFLLFLIIWLLLIRAIPAPGQKMSGWVPTSFAMDQERDFPPHWWKWLRSPPGKPGERGSEFKDGTENVQAISKNSRSVVKGPQSNNLDSRSGGGGAAMSKELLFMVRSPAKLYWLARLYDTYDGNKWRPSPKLQKRTPLTKKFTAGNRKMIYQEFFVKKAVGSVLVGAYDPLWFRWTKSPSSADREGHMGMAGFERQELIKQTDGMTRIAGKLPPLPWRYEVSSNVVIPDEKAAADIPSSYVPVVPKRYANVRISKRLRDLALSITAKAETPLDKAMALRNYLRDHYTYSLAPPRIPKNLEAVDYFLFESKVGYCSHFAQALTVLAWLNGLDARVATGYSPGNYNALTQYFEVHQYHAHAWTQINVPPYGWLTFDGVAPAQLNPNTFQRLLQKLMDPFGDEWDSRPPEFSLNSLLAAKTTDNQAESGDAQKTKPYTGRVRESKVRFYLRHLAQDLKDAFTGIWIGLTFILKTIWKGAIALLAQIGKSVIYLFSMLTITHLMICLILCLAAMIALRQQQRIYNKLKIWKKRRYCHALYTSLQQSEIIAHDAIRNAYRLTSTLLELGHYPPRNNLELDEYATVLMEHDPELAESVDCVFRHYSRLRFSLDPITDTAANEARQASIKIWNKLTAPPELSSAVK